MHLPPLPGSPRHVLSIDAILERAVTDAHTLHDAGFHAAIVENFGDAPFRRATLPPASLAAMAIVASQIRRETKLEVGINALRNDARAALGIAAGAGASFMRVNVHCGVVATDQGIIEGQAHETLAYRKLLGQRIAILADVHVKHGVPIGETDIVRAARDTAYRGLADGLIITGPATGEATDLQNVRRVREHVPDRRIFVGSGATAETVAEVLKVASGVIVGTGLKRDKNADDAIDAGLAEAFVDAAQ